MNSLVIFFVGFQVMCKVFALAFSITATKKMYKSKNMFFERWKIIMLMWDVVVGILLSWRIKILAGSSLFDPVTVKYLTALNPDVTLYHTVLSLLILFIAITLFNNIKEYDR